MSIDKNWTNLRNRLSDEYINGVKAFIVRAQNYVNKQGEVRCPCRKCLNRVFQTLRKVESHLGHYGFQQTYKRWTFHGEVSDDSDSNDMVNDDDDDEMFAILNDVTGPSNAESIDVNITTNNEGETSTRINKFTFF